MKDSTEILFDYEAVFNPDDYCYFYQEKLTDERTQSELAFLTKILKLEGSQHILDLACGYGRHANLLAQHGHQVTGIDVMPGFLEQAVQNAKKRHITVNYLCQDMRNITFQGEFDRVLLLFTAFGYFEDNENLQVLKNMANALKTHGLLCFDIPNRDVQMQQQRPYHVTEKDGNLMIDRVTFDSLTGRLYNKRIIFRNGKRKDLPFFIRLYNLQEITSLLEQAGLSLQQLYGEWQETPFTSHSGKMIIVAEKCP